MKWYLRQLINMENYLEEFKNEVINIWFTESGKVTSRPFRKAYCWTPNYQSYWQTIRGIVTFCDMLGIGHLAEKKDEIMRHVMHLNNPNSIPERSNFENYFDFIKDAFKKTKEEIRDKLKLLEDEEMDRLSEALNCYIDGYNYSTIAMSVSAIEFRLFSLMMSKCPDPKLKELTLGQLIREYLDDKKKYGKVIPKKHEPLLEHCNTYRIFSVHPKREKITRPIATSIINMTFTFLLDKKLKKKAETK